MSLIKDKNSIWSRSFPAHLKNYPVKKGRTETETKWERQKLRQIISWSCVHVTFEGSWAMIISLWVLGPILHYNWMMHGFNLIALSIKTCRKKTRCNSKKRMCSCRKSVVNVLTVSYNSTLHYVLGLLRFLLCICLVIPLLGRTERKKRSAKSSKEMKSGSWKITYSKKVIHFEKSSQL